jgi:DNA repair exonuclease SbcCD ATPase subunit
MQSDMQSDSAPASSSTQRLESIAVDIQSIEAELATLKARYQQVQTDEHSRATLKAQQAELTATTPQTDETRSALQTLTTQLDEIELRLESHLLSWLGIRQYFWQIVRFGGLGLLLGWGLSYLAYEQKGFKVPNSELTPTEQRR